MPELPEVETIKRGLQNYLPGLKIIEIETLYPGVIRNESAANFRLRLKGDTFLEVKRRGKYLLLILLSGQALVVHLRMSGSLYYTSREFPREKHLHLVFSLSDGQELRYTDPRKFGEVYLLMASKVVDFSPLKKLGIEPFDSSFTISLLENMLKDSHQMIKQFLLDQSRIAGLGNIYTDEALFLAGIHPARKASSLSPQEVRRLWQAIQTVLEKGITEEGRTFSNYRNARGEPGDYKPLIHDPHIVACPYCGSPIEKIKVSGRGTFFCSKCQK